jgi:hypothetical protein
MVVDCRSSRKKEHHENRKKSIFTFSSIWVSTWIESKTISLKKILLRFDGDLSDDTPKKLVNQRGSIKMGLMFSKLLSMLWGSKEVRILILGLDGAGKTTILYRLQIGEVVTTIPTIGFNVETVTYKNIKFQVWDLGGQTSIRPYWRCYYVSI